MILRRGFLVADFDRHQVWDGTKSVTLQVPSYIFIYLSGGRAKGWLSIPPEQSRAAVGEKKVLFLKTLPVLTRAA